MRAIAALRSASASAAIWNITSCTISSMGMAAAG
jgi:hypothetical protein